jgi:NhaP-type Na+/H+ or K+/H+ antiporter
LKRVAPQMRHERVVSANLGDILMESENPRAEHGFAMALAMPETPLVALALIIVLGAAAQWLAWRARLPSILLLLVFGFLAGPVARAIAPGYAIDPDKLFGWLLLPVISLSVAVILFEGGLSLDFRELRGVGSVVRNLVIIGALATWGIATAAAHFMVGLDFRVAALAGAVLIVTGPTVVLPMLRLVRPNGPVGPILKWEGIIIDPLGALLAVLVFEVVVVGRGGDAPAYVGLALLKTVGIGGGLGLLAAGVLTLAIHRYWIPDFLHTSITLMLVAATFAAANMVQSEAGLLAVTIMGVALANQRWADMRPIAEFKENLQVFLLSALFILLSARLRLEDVRGVGLETLAFVLVLVLVGRPVSVFLSTLGSKLRRSERLFLMGMAPRGIVAAAVASVFALALERAGHTQASLLVPLTFATIIGTVLIYGVAAPVLAARLGLADRNPQGALIAGATPLAQAIAGGLEKLGFRTVLVDTNRGNVAAARLAGLKAHTGSILGERVLDEIDLGGLGRLLALTPSNEVNVLAVRRFVRIFGRAEVYQLPLKTDARGRSGLEKHLHGRWLFQNDATYAGLEALLARGATVKATKLTEAFDFRAFREQNGADAVPLFVVAENTRLTVLATDQKTEPRPGQTLISLVVPAEARQPAAV